MNLSGSVTVSFKESDESAMRWWDMLNLFDINPDQVNKPTTNKRKRKPPRWLGMRKFK